MNKLFLYLAMATLGGCSPSIQLVTAPAAQSGGCLDKPTGALDLKNVQAVTVTNAVTKISGSVRAGQDVGYSFDAQAGQKFSYQTQDDICMWVMTPDTQVFTGGNLPKKGKYVLQVSVPQGTKTFNLDVTFGNLVAQQTSVNPSPSPFSQPTNTSPPSSVTPNPQPISPATTTTNSSNASLDQDTAIQVVNNWLAAKARIFAPPFDRGVVAEHTTGPLYNDITKPNGSIDWLQNNSSYYRYNNANVTSASNFSMAGSRPSITVSVFEDRVLQGPRGIDPNQSGASTQSFTYYFEQDNGRWKIYDYRAQ